MKFIFGNNLSKVLILALGTISIIYSLILKSRGVTFYEFFIILGILLVLTGLISLFFSTHPLLIKFSPFIKILKCLLILFFISFIVIESLIIHTANEKTTANVDYIVVLGAGVKGYTPSLTLHYRLATALEYHKEHPNTKIVLSGGQGDGENISEAEAMKRFLLKEGVNENLLIIEDKSRNTFQNLVFTKEVIKKFDNQSNIKIAIVTSDFHILRAKLLAKRIGFEPYGVPAPIPNWLAPTYYVREYFGICKSLFFDK